MSEQKSMSADSGCCSSQAKAVPKDAGCCGGQELNAADSSTESGGCCSEASVVAEHVNIPEVTAGACCSNTKVAHQKVHTEEASCCAPQKKGRPDWLLWACGILVLVGYSAHLLFHDTLAGSLATLAHTSFEMMNAMWWGIAMGALAVGALGRIPSDMVMSVLGKGGTKRGVVRATLAGLLLDLCNHGILMVAMGLYRKGASLGQVMAFMIASPWNSLTLTLILIGLIGLPWTLAFIAFSMVIAWISGVLFDRLEGTVLPANPNAKPHNEEFELWPELKKHVKGADWSFKNMGHVFWEGLKESKMVLRWVFFGVVLVSLIRAFIDVDQFGIWFGATVSGLFLTLLATTIMEVCSEGSSPIAADLVTRAKAPGNGFVFLMAGAATDYTEIMSLKDTTKSWKIALFLPLVTVPQVLAIGYLMNVFS